MAKSHLVQVLPTILTRVEREALTRAARASEDFPLLPTSDADASPHVPEEAGDNLTPGERLAVAAIVSGQTFAAAARAAKVSARTLYAWRQEPAFARAVERTSREAMDVVVVRFRNLMLRATRVLSEAIAADRESSAVHAFRVINSARVWAVAREESADAGGGESDPSAEVDATGGRGAS